MPNYLFILREKQTQHLIVHAKRILEIVTVDPKAIIVVESMIMLPLKLDTTWILCNVFI